MAHDTTENRIKTNKTLLAIMLEFSIKFITLKELSDKGSCTARFSWGHLRVGDNEDPINYLFSIK